MQPENIKVNGQTPSDIKARNFTPIENWDHLAFQVIYNEMVPHGFKKQKNGKYRGSEFVEVPKNGVLRVQRLGAQLIRGYRDKIRHDLKAELDEINKAIESSKWYQVLKRLGLEHRASAITGVLIKIETANIK